MSSSIWQLPRFCKIDKFVELFGIDNVAMWSTTDNVFDAGDTADSGDTAGIYQSNARQQFG